MAVQTATGHSVAQATQITTPETEPNSLSSGTTISIQSQPGAALTAPEVASEGVVAQPVHSAETLPSTDVVFVASATLALAALFSFGFVRSRARAVLVPGFHRLVARAEEVRVPVLLPVALAEIAWELFVDRRAISSAASRAPR